MFSDFLEEWAIRREPPPDERFDLLMISRGAFHRSPQIGKPWRATWTELVAFLSKPMIAEAKDAAGGYACGVYRENRRRKADLVSTSLLVVDVDEGGDVARIASAVAKYRAIVHETFSSTPEAPRCRLLLALDGGGGAATYDRIHAVVRRELRNLGATPDEGAKDPCRFSYAPVRRPGVGYRFRAFDGRPIDVARLLAANPPPPPRASGPLPRAEHADRYKRAALQRAADALAGASVGDRHALLNREAHGLARLDLSEAEIANALLPAAVASMGEARRREIERTIRDAVRARRGAA